MGARWQGENRSAREHRRQGQSRRRQRQTKCFRNSRGTGHFQMEGLRAGSGEDAVLNLPPETHTGAGGHSAAMNFLGHSKGCSVRAAPAPTLLANFSTTQVLKLPSAAKPSAERTETAHCVTLHSPQPRDKSCFLHLFLLSFFSPFSS